MRKAGDCLSLKANLRRSTCTKLRARRRDVCISTSFGGRPNGSAEDIFDGVDDSGNRLTFASRLQLLPFKLDVTRSDGLRYRRSNSAPRTVAPKRR
jgi:hypothetical protein